VTAGASSSREWGDPPWSVRVAVPRTALPAQVEFAVVGAGFAGLSAALALAREGAPVHVFEAGRLGDGASGRTGGIALEGTADGPREGVERCLEGLTQLVRSHAIECDLALGGCWELRHAPAAVAVAERPSWPDLGAGALVVDKQVPGGSLDPGALVAGLAAAAQRAGVVLREGSRVEACEPGAPHRLRIEGSRVLAQHVLLAIDALPPALLRLEGLRPALTLALATEALPLAVLAEVGLGATPFYTVDLPYLWGRATRDGRLVMGSGLAFDPEGDLERISVARADVREMFARMERRVRGLHPALARVGIARRWGGPIAFRTGPPVLAELAKGLLAAGAYAGHGVALALRTGQLAADHLLGRGALPRWGSAEPRP
jgi:gamma-glutamylputrescine oxidase